MALACAAVVACVGCGSNDNSSSTAGQQSQAGSDTARSEEQQAQQVTFEGCLQRGAGLFGTDYLLTMANEPPGAAGTSGSITESGSSVEREQMAIAAKTYRLEARGDVKLSDMVGKQVRVSGVISERANVPTGTGGIGSSRDTQLPNRDRNQQDSRGAELETSDLGQLDVSSASIISESCGSRIDENSGRTTLGMAGTRQGPRTGIGSQR
jgi:hypothetical protein